MRHVITLAVLGSFLLAAPRAEAATIRIEVAGLNAVYDGLDLFDAGSQLGGFGNPAQADPVTVINFFLDGSSLGVLSSGFADFAVVNIINLPAAGGTTLTRGGFLDLFGAAGPVLRLDFDAFAVAYRPTTQTMAITGSSSSLLSQALPFGLVAQEPIEVSILLTTLANLTTGGDGRVTGFDGAGNATLTATDFGVTTIPIPEPASMLLVGTGLAGLLASRYRRPHS